jgi:hypothetical protein
MQKIGQGVCIFMASLMSWLLKKIIRDKHSSLFLHFVSDEEKKFYNIDSRILVSRGRSISLLTPLYNLKDSIKK